VVTAGRSSRWLVVTPAQSDCTVRLDVLGTGTSPALEMQPRSMGVGPEMAGGVEGWTT